jgi:hypothetical protein
MHHHLIITMLLIVLMHFEFLEVQKSAKGFSHDLDLKFVAYVALCVDLRSE